MKLRVGIIGQSGEIAPHVQELSETIGREVARRGAVLFSGGTSGVMEYASKGAHEAGGIVVGVLPGTDVQAGNPYIDIPITTGVPFDWRSVLLVHSVDVLIMIAGGNGTLMELSTAYLNRKPVVVLPPSGGWSGRIRDALYDQRYLDERRAVEVRFEEDPVAAVELALRLAEDAGPLGESSQG